MTEKIVDVNSITYGNYSALVGVTQSGELLIAQPTVEILMGWSTNTGRKKIASKSLEAFAGKDYKVGKFLHSVQWVGQGKTTFYSYSDFLIILKWQIKECNEQAINLVIAGFADSFASFAYTSFGIKQTENDRQQWLKTRQSGKVVRRTLTDAIKDYLIATKTDDKYLYCNVTEAIYLGIFNRRAANLRVDWNTESPRDCMTDKELRHVGQVEDLTMRLIDSDRLHPMLAVKEALSRLIIPMCER